MKPASTSKVERFWDNASGKSKGSLSSSASKTVKHTKLFLDRDMTVLDFGCGTGSITIEIAKNVKRVKAIDTSKGMIEKAKQQAESNSILNIEYSQTSIFDEQLKEKSFDVILSFNVLHYIEDIPTVMKQINKLLKPNGYFISSTACLSENRNGLRALIWILNKLKVMPKTIFYKKSELENWIIEGNFEIDKSELVSSLPEWFLVGIKAI